MLTDYQPALYCSMLLAAGVVDIAGRSAGIKYTWIWLGVCALVFAALMAPITYGFAFRQRVCRLLQLRRTWDLGCAVLKQ